jgi:hypothetical protein
MGARTSHTGISPRTPPAVPDRCVPQEVDPYQQLDQIMLRFPKVMAILSAAELLAHDMARELDQVEARLDPNCWLHREALAYIARQQQLLAEMFPESKAVRILEQPK